MAAQPQGLEVEVVFALPDTQLLRRVVLAQGCTAADAIHAAGLTAQWQVSADQTLPLARFGRLIVADTPLDAGDRVEILRALLADPKERRRQKVKAAAASARRRST